MLQSKTDPVQCSLTFTLTPSPSQQPPGHVHAMITESWQGRPIYIYIYIYIYICIYMYFYYYMYEQNFG